VGYPSLVPSGLLPGRYGSKESPSSCFYCARGEGNYLQASPVAADYRNAPDRMSARKATADPSATRQDDSGGGSGANCPRPPAVGPTAFGRSSPEKRRGNRLGATSGGGRVRGVVSRPFAMKLRKAPACLFAQNRARKRSCGGSVCERGRGRPRYSRPGGRRYSPSGVTLLLETSCAEGLNSAQGNRRSSPLFSGASSLCLCRFLE
jgi:hypothetical protein